MFTILDLNYVDSIADFIYDYGAYMVVFLLICKFVGITVKHMEPSSALSHNGLILFWRKNYFKKIRLSKKVDLVMNVSLCLLIIFWVELRFLHFETVAKYFN